MTGEPADHVLQNSQLIITQNSALALQGYFFEKPAVLFGKIDFHHIATSATPHTISDAIDHALGNPPEFAKYLYWFFQKWSINAGRDDAKDQIKSRLTALGWPME